MVCSAFWNSAVYSAIVITTCDVSPAYLVQPSGAVAPDTGGELSWHDPLAAHKPFQPCWCWILWMTVCSSISRCAIACTSIACKFRRDMFTIVCAVRQGNSMIQGWKRCRNVHAEEQLDWNLANLVVEGLESDDGEDPQRDNESKNDGNAGPSHVVAVAPLSLHVRGYCGLGAVWSDEK